jgi:hypothetical protein
MRAFLDGFFFGTLQQSQVQLVRPGTVSHGCLAGSSFTTGTIRSISAMSNSASRLHRRRRRPIDRLDREEGWSRCERDRSVKEKQQQASSYHEIDRCIFSAFKRDSDPKPRGALFLDDCMWSIFHSYRCM